jgi:hypothetical protein
MKAQLLLLLVLLACAQASVMPADVRDNEDTAEFVDGYFAAFGLPQPVDIFQCGSDQVATSFMTFMPKILNLSCSVQKTTLQELRAVVQEFLLSLPSELGPCLDATQSLQDLRSKTGYPIDWNLAYAYIATHLSSVRTTICSVEENWNQNQYSQAGETFGNLVKKILGVQFSAFMKNFAATPKEAEQEFLNGYFLEFELSNPRTILACFPEDSQQRIFDFVPQLLSKACEMTV